MKCYSVAGMCYELDFIQNCTRLNACGRYKGRRKKRGGGVGTPDVPAGERVLDSSFLLLLYICSSTTNYRIWIRWCSVCIEAITRQENSSKKCRCAAILPQRKGAWGKLESLEMDARRKEHDAEHDLEVEVHWRARLTHFKLYNLSCLWRTSSLHILCSFHFSGFAMCTQSVF